MAQQQLATIIQGIQMDGWSGLLVAKRGQRGSVEEGTILFADGKMQEAKVGRRAKFDAFKYLCTWENCEVSFRTPDGQRPYFPQNIPPPEKTTTSENSPASFPLPPPSSPIAEEETSSALLAGFDTLVPYHTRSRPSDGLQIIENMGLTRGHRVLFLLINGERSISELARLTKSDESKVQQRLQDLEKAAVVRLFKRT